jgi:pimeloyl-ACP methyl ester carboxylesterase
MELQTCRVAVAAMLLALAGCASVPPAAAPGTGTSVDTTLTLGGTSTPAHWQLPAGEASALLVLQHGFARRCINLRETTRQLMQAGLLVLCLDAPMAGGNPMLADALAVRLAGDLAAPGGVALPDKIIVGGHSAGAAFAARLGARLAKLLPQRLAGALLFDPVATADFEVQLRRVADAGRRPVLAVFANAHACNANLSAATALRRVRQDARDAGREGFVGVQLTQGATHVDVEGEDSDWLGRLACGTPLAANVSVLRGLAVQWATDIARGTAPTDAVGAGWRRIE